MIIKIPKFPRYRRRNIFVNFCSHLSTTTKMAARLSTFSGRAMLASLTYLGNDLLRIMDAGHLKDLGTTHTSPEVEYSYVHSGWEKSLHCYIYLINGGTVCTMFIYMVGLTGTWLFFQKLSCSNFLSKIDSLSAKGGADTSLVVLTKMAGMYTVVLAKIRWNVRCAGDNVGKARRQLEPQCEYEV